MSTASLSWSLKPPDWTRPSDNIRCVYFQHTTQTHCPRKQLQSTTPFLHQPGGDRDKWCCGRSNSRKGGESRWSRRRCLSCKTLRTWWWDTRNKQKVRLTQQQPKSLLCLNIKTIFPRYIPLILQLAQPSNKRSSYQQKFKISTPPLPTFCALIMRRESMNSFRHVVLNLYIVLAREHVHRKGWAR